MRICRSVTWKGVIYPVIGITIYNNTENERLIWIASTRLENLLLDAFENEDDEKAFELDRWFGYYIDESNFGMDENVLAKQIENFYNAI